MNLQNRDFDIYTEASGMDAGIEIVSAVDGIVVYHVTFKAAEGVISAPVTVSWKENMVNHLHVWNPTGGGHRAMHQWFAPTRNHSAFCFGAPVLCTIGENGCNTETVAVSDADTPIDISFCIRDLEQQDKVEYSVCFFGKNGIQNSTLKEYEADIRIDCRKIPYYESIRSVSAWWTEYGYTFRDCPAAAGDPLYSTWYNFHQAPDSEKLLADLSVAAGLGFKTVILDDGWQFEGPSSGNYSQCGEWQVAKGKFPDFKAFADRVHAMGMKLMVWFCVPFIGIDSPVYPKFRGKYLYQMDGNMQCAVLDPRYPAVRSYIEDTYQNFLVKYDIDGFKLDFIDSFQTGELTGEYCEEMDCRTVEEAVHRLLEEITSGLARVKPGLLYEYRQNYVGPAINQYGNMLRVADCAYDSLTNRIGIVDLRLMGYPVAVHSDMLLWSKKESVTLCARQLLNILFAVPQISVILADSTAEQKKLLHHYLDYWMENRELILHGTFSALHPELNYTCVSAEKEEKVISVLYTDLPYTFTGKCCDVFHNGDMDGMIFENPTDSSLTAEIYDCFGLLLKTTEIKANTIVRLPVPKTGMVRAYR